MAGPPPRPRATFLLAATATFLVTLDATLVFAAFAALRAEFTLVSPATLSWTLNAYTIGFAALLVPAGRLADLAGRKRVFRAGVALFTAASVACAAAPGIGTLIAGRALQAVGAAAMVPAALALVLVAVPPPRRAAAVGLLGAIGALAAALGPLLGSVLVELGSWRWLFLVNLPLGAWALARAGRVLAESASPETGARVDLPGTALLIAGACLLTTAIVLAEDVPWPRTLVTLGAALALLLGLVAWARDRPQAALDLGLFRSPTFLWANLATVVFGTAFTMMFLSSFLVLQGIWGYPPSQAGLAITPGPLVVIPVAILAGRLAGRIGHRPILVAGGLLYALAQTWLALRLGPAPAYLATWLPAQLLGGAAIGLLLPALSGAAVAGLGPARLGVGGGVNTALRQLGGALGAALAVLLVGAADAGLERFQALYLLTAALGLVTAALSLPVDTAPATSRPRAA